MWERKLLLGEVDPFVFILARDTAQPLASVLAMPNPELVAWRAFYAVEKAVTDLRTRAGR